MAGVASMRRSTNARRSNEVLLADLKARLREIADLGAVGAILSWDQATYMPRDGAEARSRQGALISRLAHERMTDVGLGRLLDRLAGYAEGLPDESDDARLIAVARRDFEKAIKVPVDLVERWSALGSASYEAWKRARPNDDFAAVRPYLEQQLDISREYAELFAPYRHIIDPLIDDRDEGLNRAVVQSLFAQLRRELLPIVEHVCNQPAADDACLHAEFPEAAQVDFSLAVARAFGYDLERGRLDKTPHPFCTKFSAGDVRITTRVRSNDLSDALFSTLHEAGHALYEQGVAPELAGTPLGRGTSMGVHESQSRLWENVVGRGLELWRHFYPALRTTFPSALADVPVETFHRAINKVERSLIRTDADEVTYNLHIILRFDLEVALLEGSLAVKDLPEAWRARYRSDLGVSPPDDRDGCLQDVHWFSGSIGGEFHSYTIGNVLSAQFYAAALRAHPQISEEIAAGEFGTLRAWLGENLYRHGRKFGADEIVRRATDEGMTIKPYIAYLREKYDALYGAVPAAG
jgi:carboxypeptidase Taq